MTEPLPIAPLDREGIEDVRELMMHQDTITWTALSVFSAGQLVLLGLIVTPNVLRPFQLVGIFAGLVVTTISILVTDRSNRYMARYARMLPQGLRQFRVRVSGISATALIIALHIGFYIVWAAMLTLVLSG